MTAPSEPTSWRASRRAITTGASSSSPRVCGATMRSAKSGHVRPLTRPRSPLRAGPPPHNT
eukprot:4658384-Alexandrium_andersonii.AAC.1